MEPLLIFVIWCLVVGFVVWVVMLLLDRAPIEAVFKQVAKGAVIIIAIVLLLYRLLEVLPALT